MTDDEAITLATLHAGSKPMYAGYSPHTDNFEYHLGTLRLTLNNHEMAYIVGSTSQEAREHEISAHVCRRYCLYFNLDLEET